MPVTTSLDDLLADLLEWRRAPALPAADALVAALARVAAHFGADEAWFTRLVPDGSAWAPAVTWPTAAAVRVPPPGSLRLEVALRGRGAETVARIGLGRDASRGPWSADDERQLHLVGELLLALEGTVAAAPAAPAASSSEVATARRLEERLFVAMEVSRVGCFDWDIAADRVWYISPFLTSQGPSPRVGSEAAAASWFQATHPDDIDAARARVDQVVAGAAPTFDITVRMHMPHYREGWVHVRSRGKAVAHDASGRAGRIVGVYEDVSGAVAHAAEERRRELALEHATRSSALGMLATSLAHELNQPLAALSGFVAASARLLDAGPRHGDEVREALRRSIALAEKASEIVRRLRRLVQHAPPLHEAVGAAALMAGAVELVSRDARTAGVEVRVLPVAAGLSLEGDRVQLEQVLVNLVRNAIEACAAREGVGRLVTVAATAQGDRVEFRVTDTGAGVGEHVAGRLFEPFVSTRAGGTGLGLTISRSIVESHGGAVRLERTGPGGSTFLVSLPRQAESGHGPH